jgi:hypothetical protein
MIDGLEELSLLLTRRWYLQFQAVREKTVHKALLIKQLDKHAMIIFYGSVFQNLHTSLRCVVVIEVASMPLRCQVKF